MSDSLQPLGLWPSMLLCPWDHPGKNTGVGSQSLLQGIFWSQESNSHPLHLWHCWQAGSLPLCLNLSLTCLLTTQGAISECPTLQHERESQALPVNFSPFTKEETRREDKRLTGDSSLTPRLLWLSSEPSRAGTLWTPSNVFKWMNSRAKEAHPLRCGYQSRKC